MTAVTHVHPALTDHLSVAVTNAAAHYYDQLGQVLAASSPAGPTGGGFDPGWELPPLDAAVQEFLRPSTIRWQQLGTVAGVELSILDLRSNPATMTTRTNPSLLMVARAVQHIRQAGERIVIVTPSSANQATALRDAVLRAIVTGLVEPHELQIVCVVPAPAQWKLWRSALSDDDELRHRNPVVLYHGPEPDTVTTLVQQFARDAARTVEQQSKVRLWCPLDSADYRVADMLRAFVEQDFLPPASHRVHAHSESTELGPRRPAIQSTIRDLIGRHGGGGILVSRYEFLQRYAGVRQLVRSTEIDLPSDPRQLREWSLVMAMTGVLNAAERSLIPPGADVVVHASGSYSSADYTPIPARHLARVSDDGRDLLPVIRAAAHA